MQHSTGHYERAKPKIAPGTAAPVVAEIDALTRLIRDNERELSRLKRQRKSLVMREYMRNKRKDPAFQAAITAGIRAGWQDPAKADAWREHASRGGKNARKLPPMTDRQRKLYNKLRYHQWQSRDQALARVMP